MISRCWIRVFLTAMRRKIVRVSGKKHLFGKKDVDRKKHVDRKKDMDRKEVVHREEVVDGKTHLHSKKDMDWKEVVQRHVEMAIGFRPTKVGGTMTTDRGPTRIHGKVRKGGIRTIVGASGSHVSSAAATAAGLRMREDWPRKHGAPEN